ncbi:hypothetical protein [Streptomyces sp. DH41]|uniref:hypothetical protein n=1 Tax=Streptomyces sp. DH41 TaxID=3040125 RepID=UPI00244171AD|nr:hypothetical protein [Streptomyces sp. DH41]MDG9723227.1 hypothetical protein [Streptomyces sp. DH41]
MRKSSWAVIAALTLPVLCAAAAEAAVPRATHLPGDVTATECGRGGAVIVISADGEGTDSFTACGQGSAHDGETIT